jgi:mono/diheme cytochrome c family protein
MALSKRRSVILISFLCISFIGFLSLAAAGHAQRSTSQLQQGSVQRGKYLAWVEEVTKCAECHTPRDAQGNLDPHAWLQGAPI